MPEGPEIRRAADRIAKVLVGVPLEDVTLTPPALAYRRDELLGATVTAIDTRGKAMLTRFDNGLTLYSHNQLYGRWVVTRRGQAPNTGRSLRVGLHTEAHSALLYSATDIALLDEQGLATHAFLARVGPDVLDPSLEWRDISRRLAEPRFRRRALGALYLDQAFLAGLGNYLRSEILFDACLHPARRPGDLGLAERNRLARATLALTRRSYQTGGITNRPARVEAAKREGERRGRYRFAVFGLDGAPCPVCAARIERIDVGSRRLYLCPRCQRAP